MPCDMDFYEWIDELKEENDALRHDLMIARELAQGLYLLARGKPLWSGAVDLDLLPIDYPWLRTE